MTMKDPVITRVGGAANTHPDRFGFGDTAVNVGSTVVVLLYLIHVSGPKAVTLQQRVEIVCDKCSTERHRPVWSRSQAVRPGRPGGLARPLARLAALHGRRPQNIANIGANHGRQSDPEAGERAKIIMDDARGRALQFQSISRCRH